MSSVTDDLIRALAARSVGSLKPPRIHYGRAGQL